MLIYLMLVLKFRHDILSRLNYLLCVFIIISYIILLKYMKKTRPPSLFFSLISTHVF
jgi:hypothetical protein